MHRDERVELTSLLEMLAEVSEVGEKLLVALMRGVTQVWMEVSAFNLVRKAEHEEVMLVGMRDELDWAETTEAAAASKTRTAFMLGV